MTPEHVGPYTTVQVLGEGGMGTVYLAEQSEPIRRQVALKLMRSELESPEARVRFEIERSALALMDHPNVARVLDAGVTADGRPYVAMELVSGLPIDKYCAVNELPLDDRVRLLIDVCRAIQHAHQKGVIHRDIKPSNVLVTAVHGKPLPKVIDFGLAKALGDESGIGDGRTKWGQILGTPEYMSPEQADPRGGAVDARTDVYSLGAVLFELLTGDSPLGQDTIAEARFEEVLRRLLKDDVERPSGRLASRIAEGHVPAGYERRDGARVARALRGDLDWVVLRALEREPERRYASPGALADDLERYLRDEPVEAGPPGTLYRVRKFVRRHRVWVGASALVVAMLVVGLIVGFKLYFQAEEALERVESFVAMGIVREEDDLWPLHPDVVPAMDVWLGEADALVAQSEAQSARLTDLKARGGREYELQQKLIDAIEALAEPEQGAIARVRRRRVWATTLYARSIEAQRGAWEDVATRVALHPEYQGLKLRPQFGLVPLGPDRRSGLEEFAYLPSGSVPVREPKTGRLILEDRFAIVLVLIPPGSFLMGAQSEEAQEPNFDENAADDQSPVRRVSISLAFFLSKFECTQHQWRALWEGSPMCFYPPTNAVGKTTITQRHPAEGVSLTQAKRWAARHGLSLPTEAQWEFACHRGIESGMLGAWRAEKQKKALIARANMADQTRRGRWPASAALEPHDDGWCVHAPVGSFLADESGLYDMLGNVGEWVHDILADGPDSRYDVNPVEDPAGRVRDKSVAVVRGGSFMSLAVQLRPAVRDWRQQQNAAHDVGWRPARTLEK